MSEVKKVQGMLHPVVHTLSHWLQAWQPQRQAEGQAMILARALAEAGFISGTEIQNGVVFVEGSVRSTEDLNNGQVQTGQSERPSFPASFIGGPRLS